jgi:hypothetical protein
VGRVLGAAGEEELYRPGTGPGIRPGARAGELHGYEGKLQGYEGGYERGLAGGGLYSRTAAAAAGAVRRPVLLFQYWPNDILQQFEHYIEYLGNRSILYYEKRVDYRRWLLVVVQMIP